MTSPGRGSQASTPAPVAYVPFNLTASAELLLQRRVTIFGWSFRNMSAVATAEIDILDAAGGDVDPVFPITLAVNESSREWFGPHGVAFRNGLYVNVTSGQVAGSVLYDPRLP